MVVFAIDQAEWIVDMEKRPSTQTSTIINLIILTILLAACNPVLTSSSPTQASTATLILTPTSTLSTTPTIASTPTFATTPTEIPPQLNSLLEPWVSHTEMQISEFKTFEEGMDNKVLMKEFENLTLMFPESKGNLVIMTEGGDVGVINKTTDLMAFGQTLVGENGSTYTFLVTKDFSDAYNVNVLQSDASDYIIYPNLVNNIHKEEILRILGTLVDVMEEKIGVEEDLRNYTPKEAISFVQIVASPEEIKAWRRVKDFYFVENSAEDNIFNNYYGFDKGKYQRESTRFFFSLCNQKPEMFTRVVKSGNGSYLSARFTSFCAVKWDFSKEEYFYKYLQEWGYSTIMEAYDSLWREILLKYYFPLHPDSDRSLALNPWHEFRTHSLRHVYDNYLPAHELTSGYKEIRSRGLSSNLEFRKVDYFNFYITQVNIVNISSLR